MSIKIPVLDKGYVELLETFGDELTIVNAARVSFGNSKDTLSQGDIRLIKYWTVGSVESRNSSRYFWRYTEVIWTCSAQALLNFIELRDEPFAQVEIREYALVYKRLMQEKFPTLSSIWFDEE